MENAIEVTDLVVERGKRRVLHGISCAVPAGSVTGLLGPSGSGKTTLIRAIVGVQIVKSGTVTVLGRPAGIGRAAAHGRLRDAGAERLRRPDRPRERAVLRLALRPRRRRRRPGDRGRRAGRRGRPARRQPLRRPAQPGLAGLRDDRAARRCWCWTSRPSGRTRCCAPTCGRSSTRWPTTGTTLLVSSHVMDEAGRCDRLLLIREGRLIGDDTPAAILTPGRHRRSRGGVPPA